MSDTSCMRSLTALAVVVVGLGVACTASGRSVPRRVPPGCRALSGGYYPGRDEAPVFSPDGSRILFNRDWSTMSCLVVLNLRTRKLTVADKGLRCTCGPAAPGDYSWSPNGRKIALTVWRNVRQKKMALDVVTPGRTDALELLTGRFQSGVAWSPDGKQLAVMSFHPGVGEALWVIDATTGRVEHVVDVPSLSFEQRWSPDSSRIVFWTGHDVDVVTVATGSLETVASQAQDPAWSPDGSKLAFVRKVTRQVPGRTQTYTTTELFVANADGSGLRDIGGGGLLEHSPEWSPNGRSIAFLADYPDPRYPGTYAGPGLDVVGTDGTGGRVLVGPRGPIRDISSFDWSPDGKQIVLEYDGGSSSGLYLIRPNGKRLRRLTSTP